MPLLSKLGRAASSFSSTKSAKSTSASTSDTEPVDTATLDEDQADDAAAVGGAVSPTSPTMSAEDLSASEVSTDPSKVDTSEQGKSKQLLGILRKCISVKELTSVRISLPPSLMSGVGNLETWCYVDRGDFFVAMGKPDDSELERMLAVVRWTFTKDLKFVKHGIQKPYNSILGEHFHCHWDVAPVVLDPETGAPLPTVALDENPSSEVLANAGRKAPPKLKKPPPQTTTADQLNSSGASAKAGGTAAGTAAENDKDEDEDESEEEFEDATAGGEEAEEDGQARKEPATETKAKPSPTVAAVEQEAANGDDSDAASRQLPIEELALTEADSEPDQKPASSTADKEEENTDKSAAVVATTTPAATNDSSTLAMNESPSSADGKSRIVFLNEQISHHPPISHFMLEARTPHGRVLCSGADQLSAKFTGTNVKVFPGPWNKGLFVSFPDLDGEEYQITHPTASVAGLIRGNPYATIGEQTYITRRRGKGEKAGKKSYRAILAYAEESWISRAKFAVEGVVYELDSDGDDDSYTRVKQVPADQIVATLTGSWRGEVRYKLAGEDKERVLLDMVPLSMLPKAVAPLDEQDDRETRKVWDPVTQALKKKDWPVAAKNKTAIEQRQRDEAAERKKNGEIYKPRFFEPQPEELGDWDGRPRLSSAGVEAIEKQFKATFGTAE